MREVQTDVLVVGGGLGGVAAALACLRRGLSVALTEEYPWLGGQLTSQGVPPDEHPWIEELGATASYRELREGIRAYYRSHYPLTDRARGWTALNPGAGWVSKLCHEPRVSAAVIDALLAPWRSSARLTVHHAAPVAAEVDGDRVQAVEVQDMVSGERRVIRAPVVLDATETGDLLPLVGAEFVTGFESASDTGEPSAPDHPQPHNLQAISVCFAVDMADGDHTIDRPEQYPRWREAQPPFWGAPQLSWCSPHPRTGRPVQRLFTPNPDDDPFAVTADQSSDPGDANLWTFRRIAARRLFREGHYSSDITLVNWAAIDYFDTPIVDATPGRSARAVADARQLSLSMLYWMQTEAPRHDGGVGYPGLRLRGDVMGTTDGLAQAPYVREGRRVLAHTRVAEQDLSMMVRGDARAVSYNDTVGIGMYRIDLHPSTGGDGYIDVASLPFEIPLGALLPRRIRNLIAAGKCIGTTHITNGCYRVHPVEWNVGESAGALAATCVRDGREPVEVREKSELLAEFQQGLVQHGVELRWPGHVKGY